MDISVILPTYKPKTYLWECLNSLYNQILSKNRFEVIIILNGCYEPWNSQISNWIENHPQINVNFYTTPTPGVSYARNIGLKYAKGRYITFIDDDDYISDSYLIDMLGVADCHPDSVVLSNSISFNDNTKEFDTNYSLRKLFYNLKNHKNSLSLIEARSMFNGPCMKLLPKSLIENAEFDCTFSNGEDSLFMFEISKNISKIEVAPETAVYYRRLREDSAITSRKSIQYLMKNQFRFNSKILSLYIKNIRKYKFAFMLSRVIASIKFVIVQLIKN